MKRCLLLMLFLLPFGSLFGADDKPDAKAELKKLEGEWRMVRQEWVGRLASKRTVEKSMLIIEGAELAWYDENVANTSTQTANVSVNPGANPKQIDAEMTKGASNNKKMLGIYKSEGDKLEICWAEAGAEKRPTKFNTKPGIGSGHMWTTYERKKEK